MTERKVYPLKCQIRAEATVTRIDVYDDIGGGGWFSDGVSAADFASQMAGVKGALEVHINSGGGDVFDGIAIGNTIRNHKGAVTTVVDGLAASIASVIAQAGQERVVEPGSMMMIHDAWGGCVGSASDMAKMADTLEINSNNIAQIYASRAGGDADEWRAVMRGEKWYTAEAAVTAGLADRVGTAGAQLPAELDLAAYALPGRIAAQLRKLQRAGGKPKRKQRTANAADSGHMCGSACGPDCQCSAQPQALIKFRGELTQEIVDAIQIGFHVLNAAADEAAWDGPAAMSRASKADNPSAAFKAICAGEKSTGDPDTQAHWALPHHANPGDPPNRAGVSAALGRLNQTQGLQNKAAAQAHLEAHQRAIGSGSDDHVHTGIAWNPDTFRSALQKEDSK